MVMNTAPFLGAYRDETNFQIQISITKLLPVVLSGAAHLQTSNVVEVKWPLVANLMFRLCCAHYIFLSTTQSGF